MGHQSPSGHQTKCSESLRVQTYYAEYATTRDLFVGTTKAFARAPGYGGFLPASVANARAVCLPIYLDPYSLIAELSRT
jgi:hypothetical protein